MQNKELDRANKLYVTNHAKVRLQQRAISPEQVVVALRYGLRRRSHGVCTYTLNDRSLANTPYERNADRLRGLQVVVSEDGAVITVKWLRAVANHPGILRRRCLRERMK